MPRRISVFAAIAFSFATLIPWAVGTPIPPMPARWCTDGAGFLSEEARASIDARLQAFEQGHGNQVVVYIDRTTGGIPVEDWAVEAFESWGVGKKGKDDGAALFLFSEDQALRIEVGYGLEGQLPDAVCSRIINEVMVPKIKAGDRDGAVRDGVEAILAVISGEAPKAGPEAGAGVVSQGPTVTVTGGPIPLWQKILIGIVVIVFLIILITHPTFALWLLIQIFSAALGGGGGGGGGGGFSGGGGRSGGGGASGRW